MPHFSSCCPNADEYICQVCGKIKCSNCQPPTSWRLANIIGYELAVGNICPDCLNKQNKED